MTHAAQTSNVVVAMSGASGSVYGLRLLSELTAAGQTVYFTMTGGAAKVLAAETGVRVDPASLDAAALSTDDHPVDGSLVKFFSIANIAAPMASGTFLHRGMAIIPCSMGTIGRLAHGTSQNLLERAADVCLKEKRRLILVPRETPLHTIHLENLLTLARAGATILPAMPGFYQRPETIDDLVASVVGKVLDHLGVAHDISRRWGSRRDLESR